MPGSGQQFGWISFEALPYVARGNRSGLTTGFNMHLLAGPTTNHLPPRLYDFSLGYQNRMSFANRFSVDGAASIGVFSDFEDSARDGIRFPSHLVGMWHFSSTTDIIFGVDYLSRDDVRILPVIGYSWHNPAHSNLRFDMVFPRPRVDMRLNRRNRLYLAGLMGGGTWDIEMPDESNDVFTYRDFRLLFGFEHARAPGNIVAWEFGYIFDRQIDFRESGVETQFEDAFLLRLVSRH